MAEQRVAAVFFDLGDTLGSPVLGGQPPKLTAFDVFPFVPRVIADLKARGLKLGIISNTGDEKGPAINAVLAPTGLLDNFDPALLVYSGDEPPVVDNTTVPPTVTPVTKRTPEIFRRAAKRANLDGNPRQCLFVGEDAHEREVASTAGWRVCPHPLLVNEVLAGHALRFVRLTVPPDRLRQPWRDELQKRPVVPQQFAGENGGTVYALTSDEAAGELGAMGFEVDLLGEAGLPETADLYLLRDDMAAQSGFLSSRGEAARTFAATDGGQRILKYLPDGTVVAALSGDRGPDGVHFHGARHGHTVKLTPDPLLWDESPPTGPLKRRAGLTAREFGAVETPAEITRIGAGEMRDAVERYSGLRPLDGSQAAKVTSRHIRHADNGRVVTQLTADFEAAGQGRLQVRLHRFTHAGLPLFNVEAELTGDSPELVLITAHLDSTAAEHEPYDPAADPAPGADDDASGVAAVLTIAKRFATLAATATPARTVRFVLFNAEEQGLIGSQAYARRSKSRGEAIVAVWQMDMIAFNKLAPRSWEVHAGFEGAPAVEARSRRLAELLRDIAPRVSPDLPEAQIYDSTTAPEGDPAAGRSDHAPFQAQGYAACVVSEDFFIGPGTNGPLPEANPNYHSPGDTFIDDLYAADIARALAAAAWETASHAGTLRARRLSSFSPLEVTMPATREYDSRKRPASSAPAARAALVARPAVAGRTNTMTGSPAILAAAPGPQADKTFVERAVDFMKSQPVLTGFAGMHTPEFTPDPVVQKTSAGAAVVNLKQMFQGLPVFQMSRSVRFSPDGHITDAAGDSASIASGTNTDPKLGVEDAVFKAASHIATTGSGERVRDMFGEESSLATIDVTGFKPEVIAGFPLPARPTVLDKGPFENPIVAHLMIFNQPDAARLGWYCVLTMPGYADQYAIIVAADDADGEILYSKSTMRHGSARGRVFEFSPGIADRRLIDFPRPLSDFPAMPATPINNFPSDWVAAHATDGNSTQATLNFTTTTLTGVVQDGVVVFDPQDANGDEQKLLNIFYFCNYMHDFLFTLGFDEAAGNFQQTNFTHTGSERDPVRARAHSGPVQGTANMATGPDGLPPVMNMGLVASTGRHTAFDADVVFHEYTHGLTNRSVMGGRLNAPHSLDALQSGGMGEGWSDFYALTVQNFFRPVEKTVTGDWVVNRAGGIRRAAYDDAFPFSYGDLRDSPEVHDIGEVWCATLMMMTRKLRAALGNDQQGYRLAWQIVTDGLKLTPPNPTFLDARDGILRALDDLASTHRIPAATHTMARRAAWQTFAHFGMGVNARSDDADSVDDIVADNSLPAGI